MYIDELHTTLVVFAKMLIDPKWEPRLPHTTPASEISGSIKVAAHALPVGDFTLVDCKWINEQLSKIEKAKINKFEFTLGKDNKGGPMLRLDWVIQANTPAAKAEASNNFGLVSEQLCRLKSPNYYPAMEANMSGDAGKGFRLLSTVNDLSKEGYDFRLQKAIEEKVIDSVGPAFGKTALHAAVGAGQFHKAQLLITKGKADISIRDKKGKTALDLAEEYRGEVEVPDTLLKLLGKKIDPAAKITQAFDVLMGYAPRR